MLLLIDVILTICTGGLWFIVILMRSLGSDHQRNKAERKYYKSQRWK